VVVPGVDQLQRDDRPAEVVLGLEVRGEFGPEPGAREQEPLGEQQVALALVDRLGLVGIEAGVAEPVEVGRASAARSG
jgi:hypothetical protein